MRLMNPGLGELLDRLSILELKLAHGGGEQFEEERKAILQQVLPQWNTVMPPGFVLYSTLAAVNAAIWQGEDALRDRRDSMSFAKTISESAFLAHKIQALNDRRAELIREIGKLAGEEEHREKLSGGGQW